MERNFNVTGTELAVCSCACGLSIPALQDEVGDRKLRHRHVHSMPYSMPIIALTSQNLHWKAVPCHFDSTSILCTILTLRYLSIQASMMAHQKAN